jgi:Na+-driven multidrug efflux pump
MCIGCTYCIGLPSAYFLAFKLELGVNGLYYGIGLGISVLFLLYMRLLWRTDATKMAETISQKIKNRDFKKMNRTNELFILP